MCVNALQQKCYHGPGCGNIPDDVVSGVDELEKIIERALDSTLNALDCMVDIPRAQDELDYCQDAVNDAVSELWSIADDEIPVDLQSLVARECMASDE